MKTKIKISALFIISSLAVILMESCNQEVKHEGYNISGTVEGMSDGWVKLVEMNIIDRSAIKVMDSTQIVNGSFEFKGKVDHVDKVQLIIGDKGRAEFFLENNPIEINVDMTDVDLGTPVKLSIKGSKNQDLLEDFDRNQDSISSLPKYAVIMINNEAMEKARATKDTATISRLRKESMESTYVKLRQQWGKELVDNRYKYAEEHPTSAVSPYVLGFMWGEGRLPYDELKRIYNRFDGPAKETAFFKYYEERYNDMFVTMGPGGKVPEFTLTTVDGKELTLSEVEGKYILIDFWASWCVPCRASFPHLKELYKQYRDKGFEVVAIGTADQEDKWSEAIEEDKTPWLHAYDTTAEGENMYGPVAKEYGVPHLPTTFLVDSKGIIVLRQPQKEELDAKLEELFGY